MQFRFPLIKTFKPKWNYNLRVKQVQQQMGSSIYTRFDHIYTNIVDALINNKVDYLQVAVAPQLFTRLQTMKKDLKAKGFKLKAHQSSVRLSQKGWRIKYIETVYRKKHIHISFYINAYFGKQFSFEDGNRFLPTQKILKIGQYRYLVYNSELSFLQNIANMYKNQFFELKVTYISNKYIKAVPTQMYESHPQQNIEDKQSQIMQSEFTFMSSTNQFDWIITDINDIMKEK